MMNRIEIGSAPVDEDCAQVGAKDYNYRERALVECNQYIEALRKVYGPEPEGAELRLRANPHDFGNYYEVVCTFDDTKPAAVGYAFKLECGLETWAEANMEAPFKYK